MRVLIANEVAFVSGGEDGGSCPAAGPAGGCYPAPTSPFANDFNCFVAMILDAMAASNYQASLCKP